MIARTKGTTVPTSTAPLEIPAGLAPGAAAIMRHVVESVDPGHFSDVDAPLLEQYAVAAHQATVAAQELAKAGAVVNGKASPWLTVQEKSVRALTALSARLRICPQSRFDRLVAGSNSRRPPRFPNPDGLLAEPINRFAKFGKRPS